MWKTEEQIIYKILEQIVSNFFNSFCLWEKKSGQGVLWGKADMTGIDVEEDGEAAIEEQSGREEIILMEEKKNRGWHFTGVIQNMKDRKQWKAEISNPDISWK